VRIQVTRCSSFRTPPLQFTLYKNPIIVRFCTVEFVVIICIIHIGKSPRLRLSLAGFPRFPGHQCIIQTNRYTSGKIFGSVCTLLLYSCACASYTIYALCTPYSCKLYFCHRPAREDREDCPNHGIRVTAMIIYDSNIIIVIKTALKN